MLVFFVTLWYYNPNVGDKPHIDEASASEGNGEGQGMYKRFGKRLADILLAGLALLVLSVPMLIVALLIYCSDHGSPIFSQKRIGCHKETFECYKFRTMSLDAPKDVPTHLMVDPEQYFIRGGRILRKLSIDELPQLINIIKGDMSIVGPRPALWNQDDLVAEREKYGANDVRPGLTGWAQINGRDELEIPEKARLDGEYVQNMSFSFDYKCLISTFSKVIMGEGVIEGGKGNV